jgi:hypothetical protein
MGVPGIIGQIVIYFTIITFSIYTFSILTKIVQISGQEKIIITNNVIIHNPYIHFPIQILELIIVYTLYTLGYEFISGIFVFVLSIRLLTSIYILFLKKNKLQ